MKILIAPDKFKDSATADEVCFFLSKGIKQIFPEANCVSVPLADGGEGTLEALSHCFESEWIKIKTQDPLFRVIEAKYLWIPSKKTAIIEMARASGIELLKQNERNAMITSSFGTGILINDAIGKGAKEITLTVGGTATNDAGIGIASALGFKFFDENEGPLKPIGKNLGLIRKIEKPDFLNEKTIKFTIATDVENPFYGENGAAKVYAKQKGASPEEIEILDFGLKSFSTVLEKLGYQNPQNLIGSGAGGGVSGGLACLLNAEIVSAAEWILGINQIKNKLSNANILITGEGKVDSQTWQGKLIFRLLQLAKTAEVPVIIVCGTMEDIEVIAHQNNILYATSILNKPMSLPEALANTKDLLEKQGILLGRLLKKMR